SPPMYLSFKLATERHKLSETVKRFIKALEEKLKGERYGEVHGDPGTRFCASVPLPSFNFNDGKELCEILEDKTGNKMQQRAHEAAERIAKYIEFVESFSESFGNPDMEQPMT